MAKRAMKTVLFLGPVSDDRCQLAEKQFNAVAGRFGLAWQALSRSLSQATAADLEQAERVISWNQSEVQDVLQTQFPERAATVEYWELATGKEAAPSIEREVSGLIARILGGGQARETTETSAPEPGKRAQTTVKPLTARVGRETAGRGGKWVTTVFDLPISADQLKELGGTLKQKCGTGGTVKDGRIEIQGDQRERVITELEKLGYKVKRVGG